jgi:hypothetical protein
MVETRMGSMGPAGYQEMIAGISGARAIINDQGLLDGVVRCVDIKALLEPVKARET